MGAERRQPVLRILVLLLGTRLLAQVPDFAAELNVVAVDVAVSIHQRPVPGLAATDFRLHDNDEPRTILGVAREELPLDIVVVLPELLSTWPHPAGEAGRAEVARRAQNGVAHILRHARPEDRVAFVEHGRDPRISLPFTNDRTRLANAIRALGLAGKPSFSRDGEMWAYEYAARLLGETTRQDPAALHERRRVILKVSSGPAGMYADEPIIRRLWAENIVLANLTVQLPGRVLNPVPEDGTRREPLDATFRQGNPHHIAQATGGDSLFFPMDPRNPEDFLTPLRQRYILWFRQPDGLAPGVVRRLHVDLAVDARSRWPDAEVRAREGYVTR